MIYRLAVVTAAVTSGSWQNTTTNHTSDPIHNPTYTNATSDPTSLNLTFNPASSTPATKSYIICMSSITNSTRQGSTTILGYERKVGLLAGEFPRVLCLPRPSPDGYHTRDYTSKTLNIPTAPRPSFSKTTMSGAGPKDKSNEELLR